MTLREEWQALLVEAAKCTEPARQLQLAAMIRERQKVVEGAKITVKYGKKVLAKLMEVQPVREALEAALDAEPRDSQALQAAMETALKYQLLLDSRLLARAEEVLHEMDKAAKAAEAERVAASLAAMSLPSTTGFPAASQPSFPAAYATPLASMSAPAPPPPVPSFRPYPPLPYRPPAAVPYRPQYVPPPPPPAGMAPATPAAMPPAYHPAALAAAPYTAAAFAGAHANGTIPSAGPAPTGAEPQASASAADDDDEDMCEVCFSQPKQVLFLPCRHMKLCITCVEQWKAKPQVFRCPVCFAEVKDMVTFTS